MKIFQFIFLWWTLTSTVNSKEVKCVNPDGSPLLLECPEFVNYFSELDVCDWIENFGCTKANSSVENKESDIQKGWMNPRFFDSTDSKGHYEPQGVNFRTFDKMGTFTRSDRPMDSNERISRDIRTSFENRRDIFRNFEDNFRNRKEDESRFSESPKRNDVRSDRESPDFSLGNSRESVEFKEHYFEDLKPSRFPENPRNTRIDELEQKLEDNREFKKAEAYGRLRSSIQLGMQQANTDRVSREFNTRNANQNNIKNERFSSDLGSSEKSRNIVKNENNSRIVDSTLRTDTLRNLKRQEEDRELPIRNLDSTKNILKDSKRNYQQEGVNFRRFDNKMRKFTRRDGSFESNERIARDSPRDTIKNSKDIFRNNKVDESRFSEREVRNNLNIRPNKETPDFGVRNRFTNSQESVEFKENNFEDFKPARLSENSRNTRIDIEREQKLEDKREFRKTQDSGRLRSSIELEMQANTDRVSREFNSRNDNQNNIKNERSSSEKVRDSKRNENINRISDSNLRNFERQVEDRKLPVQNMDPTKNRPTIKEPEMQENVDRAQRDSNQNSIKSERFSSDLRSSEKFTNVNRIFDSNSRANSFRNLERQVDRKSPIKNINSEPTKEKFSRLSDDKPRRNIDNDNKESRKFQN